MTIYIIFKDYLCCIVSFAKRVQCSISTVKNTSQGYSPITERRCLQTARPGQQRSDARCGESSNLQRGGSSNLESQR